MRGDSTAHSTVLVCSCGVRTVAPDRDGAYRQLLAHQQAAGCDTHATRQAMRARVTRS